MKRFHLLGFLSALILIIVCTSVPACADGSPGPDIMSDNTFYYGSFEQDNNFGNGKEPILWRILDVDWANNYYLAVSEYGLYAMNYHHSNTRTTWANTDVRDWLNHAFASNAFTQDERKHIAVTQVSDSWDRFFLLDANQIQKYLKEPYLCTASPYAVYAGAYVNNKTKTSSWLVRTDVAQERIAWVGGAGKLYLPDSDGVNYLTSADNVVRPAMWISQDEINDGEIVDIMTAAPTAAPATAAAEPDGIYAYTIDSTIATRSGPSTQYNGIGNYEDVYSVKVISKASDGSILWLEVEFPYNGLTVRCYTGLKRVDVNPDIVPYDPSGYICSGTVIREPSAYYGPGKGYKKQVDKFTPAIRTTGSVIREENGWFCFEYEDTFDGQTMPVRVWLLPEDLQLN